MAILTITEEWQCEFCGVYAKLDTKKEVDDEDMPTLSDPVSWIFEAMNYRTNPDTDWLRHICSRGHKWCVCPHCQKSKGNKQTAMCPECGKTPKVLRPKHSQKIAKARNSVL